MRAPLFRGGQAVSRICFLVALGIVERREPWTWYFGSDNRRGEGAISVTWFSMVNANGMWSIAAGRGETQANIVNINLVL